MTGLVAGQPIINIQSGALALTDANCTLTLNNYGDLEASDYIPRPMDDRRKPDQRILHVDTGHPEGRL